MSISISSIFLMSVLVLGFASYPPLLPNSENGVDITNDLQLQLGNLAFADEDDSGDGDSGDGDSGDGDSGDGDSGDGDSGDGDSGDGDSGDGVPDLAVSTEFDDDSDSGDEDEIELRGVIASIGPDNQLTLESGEVILTDENTDFDDFTSLGDLEIGFEVDIDAVLINGDLLATQIEVEEEEEEVEAILQIQSGVSGLKVRAEILGNQSEIKVEIEFTTTSTETADIIAEIIAQFELDRDVADAALEIEQADEGEELEEKFEVEVEVEPEITDVEVELRFVLDTVDRDEILDAIVEKTKLSSQQIEGVLEFEIEEVEGEEEIEIEVEVEDGVAKVKVEFNDEKHRFLVTDDTSEDGIAAAILNELPDFPLDEAGIMEIWDFEVEEEEEEIEIEVEVEDGVAKVKVEFNDEKHRFLVTDDTSEDGIAAAILNELPDFPLDEAGIMEIWDFEVEEEEGGPTLHTTTEFNEWEAEQQAQELYDDLLEKINELEERIQALLEKYESGEYYGNVPEVDSEIKSYTISFTGLAISTDDDSIVYAAEGEIYIESLMTGESTSKYIVTGGEISIDDNTFYEFIFGKIRVSPSGSVMLIGQVIDWADESDDSSTIKLVIHSDVPLEGGFGSESLNIEILPQSTIAGQWHLSGSGSLSII